MDEAQENQGGRCRLRIHRSKTTNTMSRTLEESIVVFLSRVKKTKDCWNWSAAKNDVGYGQMYWLGVTTYAHRISWTLHKGQIPKGLFVLHRCDNPACCNPDHLFLGTQQDNISDCKSKGRMRNGDLHGEQCGSHKLKEHEVLEIRRRYKSGGVSTYTLAREFGVTRSNIGYIVRGKQWKHLPV